ncbi:hypothetical protein J4218_00360 [Candidatus Pacearchaeota archaeon]|nr:hypothetical protein [Candidatus Pacearchaeota archaeon]
MGRKRGGNGNGVDDESCLELHTKTAKIPVFCDAGGKFLCYCSYDGHPGTSLTPNICEDRRCEYYHKFYLDGNGYFPKRDRPKPSKMEKHRPFTGNNH